MNPSDRSTHNNLLSMPGPSRATGDPGIPASTSFLRSRPSCSPSSRFNELPVPRVDSTGALRKTKSGNRLPITSANVPHPQLSANEVVGDRGRKLRSKIPTATQSRYATENMTVIGRPPANYASVVKGEGSRSREEVSYARKYAAPEMIGVGRRDEPQVVVVQSENSSMLPATPEFKRMQKELESLKKLVQENKKAMKKQSKHIEYLTIALNNKTKAASDKDDEMRKLKAKSKKSDDLLSNIEANMQCQICIELFRKPYALTPCGHILCLSCLQEWFRQAPADEDEMYDEDDPDYLAYRRKRCPCCRTVVRGRPVPVFLVKSIARTLAITKGKGKSSSSSSRSNLTPSPTDDDPWDGLFPPLKDEYDESSDDDDDDDDEDDDEDEDDGSEWAMNIFGYGSDSGDEPYDGDYLPAQWEPPSVHINPADYILNGESANIISMLRRGATTAMIASYQMEYSHSLGLSAIVEDANGLPGCVSLGWSLELSAEDWTGKDYMDWVVRDITERSERWEMSTNADGSWVARKLVPADQITAYESSSSEAWVGSDTDID